jgi:hypothetical protein
MRNFLFLLLLPVLLNAQSDQIKVRKKYPDTIAPSGLIHRPGKANTLPMLDSCIVSFTYSVLIPGGEYSRNVSGNVFPPDPVLLRARTIYIDNIIARDKTGKLVRKKSIRIDIKSQ